MIKTIHINPQNLDFELPEGLIAQEPLLERDQARLLVLDRKTGEVRHKKFFELGEFLQQGDVLVLNKTRVRRAKLVGKKKTGGRVEVLLVGPASGKNIWKALVRPLLPIGTLIYLNDGFQASLVNRADEGENILDFGENDPLELLGRFGRLPLPPYIKREDHDIRHEQDLNYYQTVYASVEGSIAAPTAGLHFSTQMLEKLKLAGVQIIEVLLHVGWGTFKPISGDIQNHKMLPEQYEVSVETWRNLDQARKENRNIFAVGTTATRVLESLPEVEPKENIRGETAIFIKPGYQFKWVTSLITNLHVPRSTPIALVSAFAGIEKIEEAYQAAINDKYRFFSYGDAMLIL